MLSQFVPVVPWQPLRSLLTSVVQGGMNIATDWRRLYSFFSVAWLEILQCLRDAFKWVQDGRMEQNARWIMSSNRCRIRFFHICGDGVGEHQHIPTSGAFKWRLRFCLCGTDFKICTLKGLKVKRFTPDRKDSLWCGTCGNSIASHTHTHTPLHRTAV